MTGLVNCPSCKREGLTPDALVPNEKLRAAVISFRQKSQHGATPVSTPVATAVSSPAPGPTAVAQSGSTSKPLPSTGAGHEDSETTGMLLSTDSLGPPEKHGAPHARAQKKLAKGQVQPYSTP